MHHSGLLQMPPEMNINISLCRKEREREREQKKEGEGGKERGRKGKQKHRHFMHQIIKISYSQSIINSKYRTLNLTVVCMIVKYRVAKLYTKHFLSDDDIYISYNRRKNSRTFPYICSFTIGKDCCLHTPNYTLLILSLTTLEGFTGSSKFSTCISIPGSLSLAFLITGSLVCR